jgi:uncharacterized protein
MSTIPFNEAAITFIDDILAQLASEEAIQNSSELDGFLTGIASSPNPIMPSQWYPVLWGGADQEPLWEHADDKQKFTQLIIDQMNFIANALMEDSEEFDPLFFEYQEEDTTTLLDVEEWCLGYLHAVALDPKPWDDLPADAAGALATITYFATPDQFTGTETLSADELEELKNHLSYAAQDLFNHWFNARIHSHHTPFTRDAVKIGRNDPCNCGSGKKFKKCCG